MIASLAEALLGLVLALVTLRDVFDTVIVPGRIHGALRIPRRIVMLGLPVWKRVRGRPIGVNFAPVMLVLSFVAWLLLLLLAFGLMVQATGRAFSPPIRSLPDAVYAAGTAMTTLGLGSVQVHGAARVVMVLAGFCGLAVMTLAVTYLLEVQGNIAQRDTGVLKLTTTAGQPPSALAVLERYAALGCRDELKELLRQGRDWCAGVLQSHASHLSLIYFRSAGTGSGWPAALGTLMDLALVVEHLVDEPGTYGPAVLAREQAHRLGRDVGALLDLQPAAPTAGDLEASLLCERLRQAGYQLREPIDLAGFLAARAEYVGRIDALSQHLGTPEAPLLAPVVAVS